MDRTHRPVVALRHGQEHGQHLGPSNLADDHPLRIHPESGPHQVGERERSDAFGVGVSRLEGLVVGVQVVEAFQPDLERILDGDQSLLGIYLVEKTAQHRGLAGTGSTGDDHVRPRPHGSSQEAGQEVVAHVALDKLIDAMDVEVVPADADRGPPRNSHERVEAVAVGELEVQLRLGVVPASFAAAEPSGRGGDQLDQVVVGLGDRWSRDLRAISQVEPDPIGPGDVNVADRRVIEERLEPSEAVQPVEHGGADRVLVSLGEGCPSFGVGSAGQTAKLIGEEFAGEGAFIRRCETTVSRVLLSGMRRGERLADRPMKCLDDREMRLLDPPGPAVAVG